MRQFHLGFALVMLITMGFGSYYMPDGAFFWLASGDVVMQLVRIALSLIILVFMLTEPPRHMIVRSMAGVIALATAAWALHASTLMNTPIFDTVILLQAAIALGIAALEAPAAQQQIARQLPMHINYMVKV